MKGSHHKPPGRKMKFALALITISTLIFLFGSNPVVGLNPLLEVGQYAGQYPSDKNIHSREDEVPLPQGPRRES
jgi:hypothetical protein